MRKLTTTQNLSGTHMGNSTVYPSPYARALDRSGRSRDRQRRRPSRLLNIRRREFHGDFFGVRHGQRSDRRLHQRILRRSELERHLTADYTIIQPSTEHADDLADTDQGGVLRRQSDDSGNYPDAAIQTYLAVASPRAPCLRTSLQSTRLFPQECRDIGASRHAGFAATTRLYIQRHEDYLRGDAVLNCQWLPVQFERWCAQDCHSSLSFESRNREVRQQITGTPGGQSCAPPSFKLKRAATAFKYGIAARR